MLTKQYYVYILTNKSNTLYVGVTNNLARRLYEHQHKLTLGFTAKYKLDKLIYYEVFEDIEQAILREKYLKGITRKKKLGIIKQRNPKFLDLGKELQITSQTS